MQYLFNPFHGKLGRGGWWLLQLVIFTLMIAAMVLTALLHPDPAVPAIERSSSEIAMLFIILVVMLYTNFSTCLNRLRDSGRSGLWYLAFLAPYAGTGLMVYFCGIEAGSDRDEISNSRPPSDQNYSGRGSRVRNQVFGRG